MHALRINNRNHITCNYTYRVCAIRINSYYRITRLNDRGMGAVCIYYYRLGIDGNTQKHVEP